MRIAGLLIVTPWWLHATDAHMLTAGYGQEIRLGFCLHFIPQISEERCWGGQGHGCKGGQIANTPIDKRVSIFSGCARVGAQCCRPHQSHAYAQSLNEHALYG
jgi:hypothetical protein